jgi:RNA polymerase sigma factor (sigma-70 family)
MVKGLHKMLFMMLSTSEYSESEAIETLLARIARGDKDALGSLYERTHTAVFGFAMSMCSSPADAEDILHDTYLAVFSSAESYKANGKPMAWIMTIAKNLARMRMRKARRQLDIADEDWGQYLAARDEVRPDERILLQTAMKILSDTEQQIVMLHAVAGVKHREIAAILGMPTATVLSKYSRAIKKLRTAMEDD